MARDIEMKMSLNVFHPVPLKFEDFDTFVTLDAKTKDLVGVTFFFPTTDATRAWLQQGLDRLPPRGS